jgi:hypothetical protein
MRSRALSGAVMTYGKRATHDPAMQRGTLAVFGVLVVAVVAVVVLRARSPAPKAAPAASASGSTSVSARPAESSPPPASSGVDLLGERPLDSESKGYSRMPDGGTIPELSASAPKTVGFGVILFSYKGAQFAPSDAPSREQALAKALALLGAAKQDFAEAVKKGDRGSTTDAGRIPRGVLEPYLEYVLFSLEKATIHAEPVDTPRGYWIVRRND